MALQRCGIDISSNLAWITCKRSLQLLYRLVADISHSHVYFVEMSMYLSLAV